MKKKNEKVFISNLNGRLTCALKRVEDLGLALYPKDMDWVKSELFSIYDHINEIRKDVPNMIDFVEME